MASCLELTKKYMHVNKPLVKAKMFCFAYAAGAISLLAYLTIHAKSIGLTETQIGIVYAIMPAVNVVGPPLFGPLADRRQIHKPMMLVFLMLTIIVNDCLLLVPTYKEEVFIPKYQMRFLPSSGSNSEYHVMLHPQLDGKGDDPAARIKCSALPTSFNVTPDACSVSGAGNREDLANPALLNCSFAANLTDRKTAEGGTAILGQSFLTFIPLGDPDDACNGFMPSTDANYSCSLNIHFAADEEQNSLSSPVCARISGDSTKTFIIYFVVRGLASLCTVNCFILLDAILLALLKEHKGDYGMHKLWQCVGVAIAVPLTGVAVDVASRMAGQRVYTPAFVIFDIALFITGITLIFIKVPDNIKAEAIGKNIVVLLKYPSVLIFGLAVFCLGTLWGNLESFIFVYFQTLNATGTEMGLSVTVGNLAGMPFIFFSKAIFRYTGQISIIILAFYVYAIRYFGYSVVRQMRYVYFFEILEALTSSLMWVAAITYAACLTPPGMYATTLTIIGALHFGLGRGAGSLVGGLLWGKFGVRRSYQIMAISAAVAGTLYAIVHMFWLRHQAVYQPDPGSRKGTIVEIAADKEIEPKEPPEAEEEPIAMNTRKRSSFIKGVSKARDSVVSVSHYFEPQFSIDEEEEGKWPYGIPKYKQSICSENSTYFSACDLDKAF